MLETTNYFPGFTSALVLRGGSIRPIARSSLISPGSFSPNDELTRWASKRGYPGTHYPMFAADNTICDHPIGRSRRCPLPCIVSNVKCLSLSPSLLPSLYLRYILCLVIPVVLLRLLPIQWNTSQLYFPSNILNNPSKFNPRAFQRGHIIFPKRHFIESSLCQNAMSSNVNWVNRHTAE